MKEFELSHGWLIEGDIVNDTDYMMGTSNPLVIPLNLNTQNYFYNQWVLNRTRNWCVLYANAASLGYLMNYEFSEKELLEIIDSAEKDYWWKEDLWMYFSKWVDCVRHYWNNKYPDRKVKTFRTTIGDDNFTIALKMNHRLVVGYRTSTEYYKDSQDDWIISWEEFNDHIGWHCVSTLLSSEDSISTQDWILIQDNYTWSKKFNIYYNNKIEKLKETGTYFSSAYIYLKEKTMEETIKENIDLEWAKEMFDKWYWNGLNPRDNMSRQEVMSVLNRIMKDLWKVDK